MATKTKQTDFFAESETPSRYILSDGVSFIEHKKLDEGTFQRYQDLTSNIKIGRDGASTEIDMRLGSQREFLFDNLVTGWNLVRREKDEEGKEVEKPLPFSHAQLKKLPPHLLSGLHDDVIKKNAILSGTSDEDSSEKKD